MLWKTLCSIAILSGADIAVFGILVFTFLQIIGLNRLLKNILIMWKFYRREDLVDKAHQRKLMIDLRPQTALQEEEPKAFGIILQI